MQKGLLFLCCILLLNACIKPDSPTIFVPNIWSWGSNSAMSAEINGVSWECDTALVTYSEASGWKSVSGNSSGITITVASTDFAVDGIYPLKAGSTNGAAAYIPSTNEVFSSSNGTSGECKILENDATHIKGMFYFKTMGPISGTVIDVKKGFFYAKKP